jgi:hypothetical protein
MEDLGMRTELPHSIQFHSGNFKPPGRRTTMKWILAQRAAK